MASTTITRVTWTDGPAGTVINNARKNSDIYDKIDEMFAGAGAYATFTLGGKLAVEGFGTHSLNAGGTGFQTVDVSNTTDGTGNGALIEAKAGTTTGAITAFAQSYTPSVPNFAGGVNFSGNGVGGIQIVASNVSGVIRFYSGGNTERMRLHASGGFSVGDTTDPGTGILRVAGAGSHIFTGASSTAQLLEIKNTTSSTTAYTEIREFAGTSRTSLFTQSQGYTPVSTWDLADSGALYTSGAAGLSIVTANATGDLRFYPNSTRRGTMFASGGFSWGDATDPGATNFRVAGTTTLVGSCGTLLHGDGSSSAPSISFSSDTDTGMWWISSGVISINCNGTINAFQFQPRSFSVNSGAFGTGAVPGGQVLVGRNTSGGTAAGTLALTAKDGVTYYLWVEAATGKLRIATAPPEEDGTPADSSGTVVGTQA